MNVIGIEEENKFSKRMESTNVAFQAKLDYKDESFIYSTNLNQGQFVKEKNPNRQTYPVTYN